MSNQDAKTNAGRSIDRRDFIQRGATAVAAAAVSTRAALGAVGANDRIGVGFIGAGGRGSHHLSVVNHMKTEGGKVEIVAVCDTYRPRMRKAADAYNAKGYTDYRELLADSRVDVVCIATPDHHHGYAALDAVKAGKDVYCEKPVTHWSQFDLTKKLAEAVEKSDSVFQLGSQGMSDGAWHVMRKLIQDGQIGQPIHAECGYFRVGDWGERGMPIDDPNVKPGHDLDWEAFLGDAEKRPFDVSRYFRWRMYEDYAGGPSTDLFPHSLTPVLAMLGVGMPSLAVGTGGLFRYPEREIPDTFNMLIDYPEKITVAVLGTQGNNEQGTGARGAGGRIPILRGWEGSLSVDRKTNTVAFTSAEGSTKKSENFPIPHGESMTGHWGNLLDCVRSRNKATFSPMALAFKVQTALQMAMLGMRADKIARFDAEAQKIIV